MTRMDSESGLESINITGTFSNDSLAFVSKFPLTSIRRSVRVHTMDLAPAWSQAWICGRVFSVPQAFSCHKRSCPMSKKRLSSVLERAKEVWQARKRRKAEVDQSKSSEDSSNQLENDSDTSCPSSSRVDVLNYTCIHPQVCRLSSYRQHRLLIRSCSECRYLRCKL
jgi:hypothetical protein